MSSIYVDTVNTIMYVMEKLVVLLSILSIHVSRYALESPIPPADLIALSPGYRVPPDLATFPYIPWHTQFVLTEATTSFQMFETMLPAP